MALLCEFLENKNCSVCLSIRCPGQCFIERDARDGHTPRVGDSEFSSYNQSGDSPERQLHTTMLDTESEEHDPLQGAYNLAGEKRH